nr:putative oxidoreductase [Salmonella sp. NCTC 7297]
MNTKIDALNYYGATKKYPLHFPALQEDIDADVVIIGGGFSGINTALELAEQGITNIVVLEARHLGLWRYREKRWPGDGRYRSRHRSR